MTTLLSNLYLKVNSNTNGTANAQLLLVASIRRYSNTPFFFSFKRRRILFMRQFGHYIKTKVHKKTLQFE